MRATVRRAVSARSTTRPISRGGEDRAVDQYRGEIPVVDVGGDKGERHVDGAGP